MKIWEYIFRRSPQNAAKPDVGYENPEITGGSASAVGQPLETNARFESILGFCTKVGSIDSAAKGPYRDLITVHNHQSILAGACNHVVTQIQSVDTEQHHVRGLAGPCVCCTHENQQRLQKGEISPPDAERLSLVCSDCGKITTSGLLACPRHYTAVAGPDGKTIYLDPEEAKQLKRKETLSRSLGALKFLFGQDVTQREEQIDAK